MNKLLLTKDDIHRGDLICVNRNCPIKLDIDETQIVKCYREKESAYLPKVMKSRIEWILSQVTHKEDFIIVSGYRSKEEQKKIWDNSITDNGYLYTQKYVAIPGCSEHQTGLAIDMGIRSGSLDIIKPDFPLKGVCDEFRRIAFQNGFIQRYPKGKENITKIGYEPWHFRFVGIPHARIMQKENMVLEEYVEFLKEFKFPHKEYVIEDSNYIVKISYIQYEGENVYIDSKRIIPFTISGNNKDGWVMTSWEKK